MAFQKEFVISGPGKTESELLRVAVIMLRTQNGTRYDTLRDATAYSSSDVQVLAENQDSNLKDIQCRMLSEKVVESPRFATSALIV